MKLLQRKHLIFTASILLIAITLSACGGGTHSDKGPPTQEKQSSDGTGKCAFSYVKKAKVSGRLYVHPQKQGLSEYNQGYQGEQASLTSFSGVGNADITVAFPGGKKTSLKTCENGLFSMNEELGTHNIGVLAPSRTDCTTNNCPTNFANKVAKTWASPTTPPTFKMVTFGDSIASFPAGKKHFPEYFKDLAKTLATVENENISVPGSTTSDWLPSVLKHYKTKIIDLNNQDADLYVFTLGGNDLQAVIHKIGKATDISEKIKAFNEINNVINQAMSNIKKIIDDILKHNPNANIVWVSYLDSSDLLTRSIPNPVIRNMISNKMKEIIKKQRDALAGYKNTMVLDASEYAKKNRVDLNTIMITSDYIHLNDEGQKLFAKLLFQLLGGFILDQNVGKQHYIGYPTK